MDLQLLLMIAGLLLIGLSFFFFSDRLFWPAAILSTVLTVPLLAILGGALPLLIPLLSIVLAVALFRRRPHLATCIMAPLGAGAALALHWLMYLTGGMPIALLLIGMGGGISFVVNTAWILFLLAAATTLAVAWKSPYWARIVVATLFGTLFTTLALVLATAALGSESIAMNLAYWIGLAVSLLAAVLVIYLQHRRPRQPAPTLTDFTEG
jgi:hypothetical protein